MIKATPHPTDPAEAGRFSRGNEAHAPIRRCAPVQGGMIKVAISRRGR